MIAPAFWSCLKKPGLFLIALMVRNSVTGTCACWMSWIATGSCPNGKPSSMVRNATFSLVFTLVIHAALGPAGSTVASGEGVGPNFGILDAGPLADGTGPTPASPA